MLGWLRTTLMLSIATPVSLIGIPVQMLALRTGRPHPGTIPLLWHRMALKLLGIRIQIVGEPAAGRPLLLVANHVSWADIPVLGSVARVSFVAKSDMITWPVFGLFARLQRSVFVERERTRSSGRQAGELGERLAAGDVMVLFAEGTTADGNAVAPFKTTLFGAANAALAATEVEDVTIQPVTIAYTRLHGMPMGRLHRPYAAWIGEEDLAPHLGRMLAEGAVDVEVHFGEPVSYRRGSDRKAMARQVEATIRATLAQALRNPRPSAATGSVRKR